MEYFTYIWLQKRGKLQLNKAYVKENTFLLGLLAIAALLRFIPLFQYQFSHDELSALSRSVFPTLKQTLQLGVQYGDTHPFLIQVFIYYWIKLFGASEIAIKLPFLICGIAVVVAGYEFSKKWFGLNAAILAGVFFSCSFIFCVYSSYARMYIPGVLFSICTLHYLFYILYDATVKRKHFIGFGIFCLLCAFNNHLNALFAFTCALSGLFLISKKNAVSYLLTLIATVICYLPHLPITLTQLQMGGLGAADGGWLPPPKPGAIIDYIIALTGTGYAGIINSVLLTGMIVFSIMTKNRIKSPQWLLLILFLCNYFIIYFYSIFKSPVLQFSVLLFSGVCLLFFATSFITSLSKKITIAISSAVVCCLVTPLFCHKGWTEKFHQHVFDKMTTESYKLVDQYGQKEVSSIYFSEPYFVIHYVLKHNKPLDYKLGTDPVFSTVTSYRHYLSNLKTSHLVLGNSYPHSIEIAKEYFPYIENCSESYFYNVITLSKKPVNKPKPITDSCSNSTGNLLTDKTLFTLNTPVQLQNGAYVIDSLAGEFPFGYKANFKDLRAKEGEWLFVKVTFNEDSLNLSKEDLLCFSVTTGNSSKDYFGSGKFSDFHFSKGSNILYLELFVGSELETWNKSGELTLFVWKKDKSTIRLKDFTLTKLDYNPKKWQVWN